MRVMYYDLLQFSAEEGLETGPWTAPAYWLHCDLNKSVSCVLFILQG